MRRRLLSIGLPLLAAVALAFALLSIQRSNASQVPQEPSLVLSVQPTAAGPIIGGLGRIDPEGGVIELSPEVPGVTEEVLVEPGDVIAAGQTLLTLRSVQVEAAIRQREADLALALALAREAESREQERLRRADLQVAQEALTIARLEAEEAATDAEIGTDLAEDAVIPAREQERRARALAAAEAAVVQREAELERARAAYALVDPERPGATLQVFAAATEQARAALDAALVDRALLAVTAPADGLVLSVEARPGEFVQPGAEAPVTIGASALVLRVQIDEEDVARLSEQPSGYALRRGEPDRRIPLTFLRAEPVVVPKRDLTGDGNERMDTRVLELVFRLGDGAGAALRVGETLDAFVEAET